MYTFLHGKVVLQVIQPGPELGVERRAEGLHTGSQSEGLHGQAAVLLLPVALSHTHPGAVAQQIARGFGPQKGSHVQLVPGTVAMRGRQRGGRLFLQISEGSGEELRGAV